MILVFISYTKLFTQNVKNEYLDDKFTISDLIDIAASFLFAVVLCFFLYIISYKFYTSGMAYIILFH